MMVYLSNLCGVSKVWYGFLLGYGIAFSPLPGTYHSQGQLPICPGVSGVSHVVCIFPR